ncbi:hypothetical protein NE237_029438 [Protea cynaroides]|uniref:Integrase zinc-binding domain-containing protein n=1 Tax=Protea cynaroides TaxID=273540 RepID=A0A9Q0JUT5_9MAGN|nr:hypothetical protein NE237_029438 [Protea cynaroides]
MWSEKTTQKQMPYLNFRRKISLTLKNRCTSKSSNKKSISKEADIKQIDNEATWIDLIRNYIETGELPEDRLERCRVQAKFCYYTIMDGKLYYKSLTRPFILCLTLAEAHEVMWKVYEGLCSSNIGSCALFQRLLRQGYYWPKMLADYTEFATNCKKC